MVHSFDNDAVFAGVDGLEVGRFRAWRGLEAGSGATLGIGLLRGARGPGEAWIRTGCRDCHLYLHSCAGGPAEALAGPSYVALLLP